MTETSRLERIARLRRMTRSGAARAIRISADLSMRELANEVGVAPTTIMRWETGQRSPHGEAAERYARTLDRLTAVSA